MILKKRIPNDFYKLFRTQNMDYYMLFLVAIYEENNEEYATLGLTKDECKAIIAETISKSEIAWKLDEDETEPIAIASSPSSILTKLIDWGWMKADFDERINKDILSFPEYSQLYVELFEKLQREDDSKERESILAIYSALFTYKSDQEKNNDILKNALQTSKRLGQLLSNMQDGMRSYFDELSNQKKFIGIQEVLVAEINNSDSRKYAILTTTDSFYRYKEEVKELISQILEENDSRRFVFEKKRSELEKDSIPYMRNEKAIELCEEATRMVHLVEREFDLIERKYNHLVEQKAVFAKRALARIHYILQEDHLDDGNTVTLVSLLEQSAKKEEIMESLQNRIRMSVPFKNMHDNSLYNKRMKNETSFEPVALQQKETAEVETMTDFVPKPLYTRKQLDAFKRKNMHNGVFQATEKTVETIDDLEKLLFLWQEATNVREDGEKISVLEDIHSENGFTFSGLRIGEENIGNE